MFDEPFNTDYGISDNFEFGGFDFNLDNFELSANSPERRKNRIQKPVLTKDIKDCFILYDNALKFAKEIELKKNKRYYAIISGDFIFGDFVEALIVENDWHVKELTISTLSLSYENIDSLHNLLEFGFVDKLNLLVSVYFYSHERNSIIKYAYQKLDIDNKFQLAVCAFHTKIAIFETWNNGFVCIHGSANLRSSRNFEQIVIEENEDLYHFNYDIHKKVLDKYFTINKAVREKQLWQTVKPTTILHNNTQEMDTPAEKARTKPKTERQVLAE